MNHSTSHDRTADRNNGKSADHYKDPATLEHEVDEVRAHLEETVDRLSHRLSPGELLDRALGYTREHGGEMAHQLGRQVKYNPVPMLLTGIGLTWLMSASAERHAPARRSGSDAMERLSESAGSVRDKARSARQSLGEQASDLRHTVRDRAESAQRSFEHLLHDQPLVAGALGVALGAAIGALLPSTDTEDEWMGEASDRVKQNARETASGLSASSEQSRSGTGVRTAAETVSQGHSPEFPEVR